MAKADKPPIKLPAVIPPFGFYYLFKHDVKGEINNCAYELVGLKYDSVEEEWMVVYRSLSADDELYLLGHLEYVQPLSRFLEDVEMKVGKRRKVRRVPRFSRITDSRVIRVLRGLRSMMYEKRLPRFRFK